MPFGYVSEIRREGRIEGMVKAALIILEARGIEVDDDQRRRLMDSLRDAAEHTVNRRLLSAATVDNVEDLIRDPQA